jgi:hypothetical protein
MRYVATLVLPAISAMTGIDFLLEWHEIFAVLAVITVIFIGVPVLSFASNFWFGEALQIHVYDQDEVRPNRLSAAL